MDSTMSDDDGFEAETSSLQGVDGNAKKGCGLLTIWAPGGAGGNACSISIDALRLIAI
jgi:hypothetical protein